MRLSEHPEPAARGLFDRARDVIVTRAPGRLDLMGGIADYSGSLVLELPIREAAFVAVQSGAPSVAVASVDPVSRTVRRTTLALDFVHGATYAEARAHFARDSATHWVAYVAGLLFVLRIELGVRFDSGVRILLASTVPEGKGVSSSAAVEVSTLCALLTEKGIALDPISIATLAQKAENLVAGAPCGIMDQLTAVGAETGQLLEISCQPASIRGTVPVPDGLELVGLDSGVRHAVTGADYGAVRVAAFMGYRIIAARAGLSATVSKGVATVDDPRWGGFLANLTTQELEQHRAALPLVLSGAEFLATYGGTTDPVTSVNPEKQYPVRNATEHPVFEHVRVRRFRELLTSAPHDHNGEELGALMAESHASYSACGLGSHATDELVRLAVSDPSGELLGAKITGGGSGGTVAILVRAGARAALERVTDLYLHATGRKAHLFCGSSPGALRFGAFRLHFAAEGASKLERVSG
jgi:L-arabinokinase